jgi:RNA polymerase sigma factor (sigma-70 family)
VESDEVLIGRLAETRDQRALESLHARYSTKLFSVALRILGDSASADELVQDIFFQLWQKVEQFDSQRGSLISWLLAITRNRAISRLRKNREGFGSDLEREADRIPATGPTALDQHIVRELVSAALSNLSRPQRDAVTLAYFEGLTSEEIATHTRAPLGTVKTRLRSALREMKRTLSRPISRSSAIPNRKDAALEDILITDLLFSRPLRLRDPKQEGEALQTLGTAVASFPQRLIDSLLQLALDLCRAGTAGLSFLEADSGGAKIFRWTHLAGKLRDCVGGTTPRNFSPCGVTLDRNSPQLFDRPGRYFHYFNGVPYPIVEGLVIPFHVGQVTEGTVWIVSHREDVRFDSEDARIMTSLTEFAGCALHLMNRLESSP